LRPNDRKRLRRFAKAARFLFLPCRGEEDSLAQDALGTVCVNVDFTPAFSIGVFASGRREARRFQNPIFQLAWYRPSAWYHPSSWEKADGTQAFVLEHCHVAIPIAVRLSRSRAGKRLYARINPRVKSVQKRLDFIGAEDKIIKDTNLTR
jgi:hypothetical protein